VKSYSLVLGNPARFAGWMSEYGHRLNFDDNGIAVCSESNQKYTLENEEVRRIE
jgi:UDP-2-acetamido-3-amino-2,3-dideoxy-glucuronate N-acetyltransferase